MYSHEKDPRRSVGPEFIKRSSCSTQLSIKFIMLINVKIPTIVGILTFISVINATSERLKARHFLFVGILVFYEQLKFRAQLSWAWQKFYNLWPCFVVTPYIRRCGTMTSHQRWFLVVLMSCVCFGMTFRMVNMGRLNHNIKITPYQHRWMTSHRCWYDGVLWRFTGNKWLLHMFHGSIANNKLPNFRLSYKTVLHI